LIGGYIGDGMYVKRRALLAVFSWKYC